MVILDVIILFRLFSKYFMLTSDLSNLWEFVSQGHFMQNSPRVIAFVCNNQNFPFYSRNIISLIASANEE
jgi:hypothetical protein